jgi:hypothetical protein
VIFVGGGCLTEDQWYSNKQLFEMMQEVTTKMAELQLEMAQTTILIRDYNGLRQKIMDCEKALYGEQGKGIGGKEMWGYIIGGLGAIFALISFMSK